MEGDVRERLTVVEADLLGCPREYVRHRGLEAAHYQRLGRPFRENRDRWT